MDPVLSASNQETLPSAPKEHFLKILLVALALLLAGGVGAFYFLDRQGVSLKDEKTSATGCDDLTGENKDRCLVVLAANSKQVSVCNNITERKRNHDFCTTLLSAPQFSTCRPLTDFAAINQCVSNKSRTDTTLDSSDSCEIFQGAERDSCYVSLAPRLKDYSLCERVIDKTEHTNYEMCRMQVALALKDEKACLTLGQYYKPYGEYSYNEFKSMCLLGVASQKRDLKICDLLPETSEDGIFTRATCAREIQMCISEPNNSVCTLPPEPLAVSTPSPSSQQFAAVSFSGNPEANVRYKDKDGLRFELNVEPAQLVPQLFDFIKTAVPQEEVLTTSVVSGHVVRGLAKHDVLAYLPSQKMLNPENKILSHMFRGGDLNNEDLHKLLDKTFNLSKDDAGNFNLPLTSDAVADDLMTIYSTGSPDTIYALMQKYHSRYLLVLPLDSYEDARFPNNTTVSNRMMRGQEVRCFSLLKTVTESTPATDGAATVKQRGSIYKANDSCPVLPSAVDLSGQKPLWQEKFDSGAGSWSSASSFSGVLARFERVGGDGQVSFPEFRSGAIGFNKKITFPSAAKYLIFDFYFENSSGDETVDVSVGKTTIFKAKAGEWNFNGLHSSPVIEISPFAGTDDKLGFTFRGDGDASGNKGGARLFIDNIKVY